MMDLCRELPCGLLGYAFLCEILEGEIPMQKCFRDPERDAVGGRSSVEWRSALLRGFAPRSNMAMADDLDFSDIGGFDSVFRQFTPGLDERLRVRAVRPRFELCIPQ